MSHFSDMVVLSIRVPFRVLFYGCRSIFWDPKRDPNLENCPYKVLVSGFMSLGLGPLGFRV